MGKSWLWNLKKVVNNLFHFSINISLRCLTCVCGIEFWHLECVCEFHFFPEEERTCCRSASFFPPSLSAISLKQTHRDILILCLPIQSPLTAVSSQNMSVTKCQVSLACTRGAVAKQKCGLSGNHSLNRCNSVKHHRLEEALRPRWWHTALSQTQ